MNGLIIYVPEAVDPSAIARLLAPSHGIQWPSADDPRAMVAGDGAEHVWIQPIEESELEDRDVLLARDRLGPFGCIGLFSNDFVQIAELLRPVLASWPCLVDDDGGHIFDGGVFANWLDKHPSPTWEDVHAGALVEMPMVRAGDIDEH